MKKDNELIAEFMGELGLTKVQDNKIVPYVPSYKIWQTLMPVVEKISKTKLMNQSWYDVKYRLIEADIHGVYKAVVEFIKWYNQSLKK